MSVVCLSLKQVLRKSFENRRNSVDTTTTIFGELFSLKKRGESYANHCTTLISLCVIINAMSIHFQLLMLDDDADEVRKPKILPKPNEPSSSKRFSNMRQLAFCLFFNY